MTVTEQVAEYLMGELLRGRWVGEMPGVKRLEPELGVNHKTVEAALQLLEKKGFLVPQGAGRQRRIVLPDGVRGTPPLKVGILFFEPEDLRLDYITKIQHLLAEQGHTAFFSSRSMSEMGMDMKRIVRLVDKTSADAWVVIAGSREVLMWFAKQRVPAFALFGRRRGLPMAGIGPDKVSAHRTATRCLCGLGHQRVALIVRPTRRLPQPGLPERAFLEELELYGIVTGEYNIPEWNGSIVSLHKRLDEMFRHTPPTALIIDEPVIFLSVQQHLARRGIFAPDHVSLVCTDGDPYFSSMRPTVAHIRCDIRPWARRIVGWANGVAQGKDDRRQTLTKTELILGGTIGPVPGKNVLPEPQSLDA